MGTDSLNSQGGKEKGDRWKGETRNSVLGSSTKESPTPHDTATSFQSDQQYRATASDPVASRSTRPATPEPEDIRQEQVTATETPAEEIEEERARGQRQK
jgi:hypothetical protein